MKNYEVMYFVENFGEFKNVGGSIEFTKPLVKNFKLAQEQVEALEVIHTESVKYKEFLKEKEVLLNKHCKKDEANMPVYEEIKAGNKTYKQFVLANQEEYNEAFSKLMVDYNDEITAHIEKEKKFEEAIMKESEITFRKIQEDTLPKLSVEQLLMIEEFIEYKED